jgi:hypothetical protein
MSSSLFGNVYCSPGEIADTQVLREVVKGGNLGKKQKTEITKAIKSIEKEEEKNKQPAVDLRAMYGN